VGLLVTGVLVKEGAGRLLADAPEDGAVEGAAALVAAGVAGGESPDPEVHPATSAVASANVATPVLPIAPG
jgi:hypothetical protein